MSVRRRNTYIVLVFTTLILLVVIAVILGKTHRNVEQNALITSATRVRKDLFIFFIYNKSEQF
ncbi:unnamed protein product [Oikopleura dioica]|nr:unnamed protein product [Oikopleura dioica]